MLGEVQDAINDFAVYLELHEKAGASSGEFRLEAIESQPQPFQQATISHCQVRHP